MTPGAAGDAPTVLAVVGTDWHPFDRLIQWVDRWLADGAAGGVRCVVQYGSAAPPTLALGRQYLGNDELRAAMSEARVVVCHGGPATIQEARQSGHLPIVVPRDDERGEHVDDHQLLFARRLAQDGIAVVAETEDEFRGLLTRALSRPDEFALAPDTVSTRAAESVRRFAHLVDALFGVDQHRVVVKHRITVLYLGGWGRSGSTLLDRVAGQLPAHVSVGELVHLWERGLQRDERCGCGLAFSSCPFWIRVGREAFGGWNNLDIDEVLALKRSVDRTRFLPLMLVPWLRPSYRRRMLRYGDYLVRLYAAVSVVSGASVVVDSSKHASSAYLLRQLPEVDLRVVQVLRDSRGVAHSWRKQVLRPEIVDHEEYMPTYSPLKSSLLWMLHNLLFLALGRLGVAHAEVRYEDLVRDPVGAVNRLAAFVGSARDYRHLEFMSSSHVDLQPAHTVAGNPMRFRTGRVDLRPDDAWRTSLPRRQRAVVSALTWPLRARYGYTSRPHQRAS